MRDPNTTKWRAEARVSDVNQIDFEGFSSANVEIESC